METIQWAAELTSYGTRKGLRIYFTLHKTPKTISNLEYNFPEPKLGQTLKSPPNLPHHPNTANSLF